jgi:hypothetical protein
MSLTRAIQARNERHLAVHGPFNESDISFKDEGNRSAEAILPLETPTDKTAKGNHGEGTSSRNQRFSTKITVDSIRAAIISCKMRLEHGTLNKNI